MESTGQNKHKLAKKLYNDTLQTKANWPTENENMVNKNSRVKPKQNATPTVEY